MNRYFRRITVWAAMWASVFQPSPPLAAQQTSGESKLNVVIVEGQGAIHNIRQRSSRDIAVQVEDASRQPVTGASVTFTLPSQGASGAFFNGERTLVTATDAQGRAVARGFKPNNAAGKLEIRVTASHQGQSASAVVTQFNMAVQNPKSGGSGKWIALLIVGGAAGAGGAVYAARRSGSSGAAAQPPAPAVISISPGTGTVGPPQ